ncbi:MAG: hypothetical protein B7Y88_00120 [Sphingomonadales bacterium 32-64-17]|nr:MAG: hypothetical protein B7Y88_00120 [Sphingomonadales bacterium 32-64-17]
MDASVKWIGGASLVLVAAIALLLVAGRSLETEEVTESWLKSEDVLPESADASAQASAVTDPTADYDGFDPVDPQAKAEAERALAAAPDYDPSDPFVIKRVLPIDGPIRYGEWHWDDAGVPDGPLRITVDLEARVISVFRSGYEIGAAAAMLGTPAHPTPTGVFPILTKERHNVSEKYGNAPMPWTLRLTWDGIAIHGGSEVERGYASHGCIGVPDQFVSKLYDIAKVGDVVIITDGVRTGVGGSLETG